MKFKIKVTPGTENMVAKGILSKVVLDICEDNDKIIVTINDILVRNGKEDEPFVAYPSKENGGKYYSTVFFYPEDKTSWQKLNAAILKKHSELNGAPVPVANKSTPKPISKPVPPKVEAPIDDLNFDG